MFYLISSSNPDHKCVILGGKVYIIGRRDCDVLIPSDATVSRKHAELSVSHTEGNIGNVSKLPILKLKDISKFGTWVNEQRVEAERIVHDGDSVYFGSPKSTFMVVYEPLVVTSSCLDTALKKSLRQGLCTLGGHMVAEWQRDCSLLVMSKISVTIKVICALVSQKYVVTPQYIQAYVKHLQGLGEKPDPSSFTPELSETQLDGNDVSFNPDSKRKSVFQGKTFYFLSSKQLKKMNLAIELAGGMSLLLEKGKMEKEILKPGSLVMSCTDAELTQSADTWVSHIQHLLDRHKKHMISDAEIGYAVLYCSTDKHCNPDYIPDISDISHLPSQSLSQVEPLVANTQTQERTQKETRTPRKGARKETQAAGDDTGRTQTPRATQRDQITEREKSPVVPVEKDRRHSPTSKPHQKSLKKRDRSEEEEEPVATSKRIKAEPVTPSKPPTATSHMSKNKSSTSKPQEDEAVWDSDGDIDYSEIDTDISVRQTDRRTSPRPKRQTSPEPERFSLRHKRQTSPEPERTSLRHKRQTSPEPERTSLRHKRQTSPVPEAKEKKGRADKSRSRSRSPTPKSRSPVQDVPVKTEPVSPSPKRSSRSNAKGQSKDSEGEMEVKVEQISQSETVRQQEVQVVASVDSQLKREEVHEEIIYDRKSSVGQGPVTAGFFTSRVAVDDQDEVRRNPEAVKEENLPVGCIHVETVSLIVRRPVANKEKGQGDCPEGFFRWKGKVVRNYKKFKKTGNAGSQGLPRIIGGSDLEVHVAKRSKEIDDWFEESVQAEKEHAAEDKRAQKLFDFNPSAKRRGR